MITENRFESAEKHELGELINTSLRSSIDNLAEDVYEHFLRESRALMMDDGWHEMALAVADRFRELILESEDKNNVIIMSDLASECVLAEANDNAPAFLQG